MLERSSPVMQTDLPLGHRASLVRPLRVGSLDELVDISLYLVQDEMVSIALDSSKQEPTSVSVQQCHDIHSMSLVQEASVDSVCRQVLGMGSYSPRMLLEMRAG